MPFSGEEIVRVAVRIVVFAFLGILGMIIFGPVLLPIVGYFPGSALTVFAAAAMANAIAMRIYERAGLTDIGFAWSRASVRNLLIGLGGGIAAAAIILVAPLAAGAAELSKLPPATGAASSTMLVMVMLLFGGIGEEMLFHGYGFQLLLRATGPWSAIVPTAVLFALAHANNLNVNRLGLANTAGWGVLLGYAFWRSGDLWLPIGLHVGWNWTLPFFGVNLSGFTINVTGYAMRWKIGPLWSGGEYGPEAGILTCFILVALFFFIWRAPVERQKPLLLRAREEE